MVNKECPCTYPSCEKHGHCELCISYHRNRKEIPACYFSKETEKEYDRSIKRFIKMNSK